jgi:ribose-phosphate pyrophosphokinase
MMNNNQLISFGTYYSYLEESILKHPESELQKCNVSIEKFNNNELSVKFLDSLRGKHLFIFGEITNNFMELLLTIDAAKRSSVKEMTVVLPYYGYSRQDKREGVRGCLGASVVAHVLQSMGISRVVSIDVHAEQIQGFFQIPFERIRGKHIFMPWFKSRDLSNAVIATPDAGGTVRASKFANELDLPLVTVNKMRDKPGHVAYMELAGNVEGKDVYVIDDMVDTGGTTIKVVELLKEKGAKNVYVVFTHPILSNNAKDKLIEHKINFICTDTLNTVKPGIYKYDDFSIEVLSCGDILAETMSRIADEESVSLFSL